MKMTNELFMQIRFLHTFEHLSSAQISQKLGLPARTVRNWWNEDFFPVKMNRIRHRLIKPYEKKINSLLAETPTLSGTQLYQRLKGFTAFLAVISDLAPRLLQMVRQRNLRIPEDISLIAYEYDNSAYQTPPLTTIEYNYEQLVRKAIEQLKNEIAGKKIVTVIQIPCKFNIRSSTAALSRNRKK